jgi:hypothetical protein
MGFIVQRKSCRPSFSVQGFLQEMLNFIQSPLSFIELLLTLTFMYYPASLEMVGDSSNSVIFSLIKSRFLLSWSRMWAALSFPSNNHWSSMMDRFCNNRDSSAIKRSIPLKGDFGAVIRYTSDERGFF